LKQARFYCKSIKTGLVELSPDQAHHLANVLRLVAGDNVELFDGRGTVAQASITEIKRKIVKLDVQDIQIRPTRTTGRVVIAASVPKGHRLDLLVTKSTELGVDHIAMVAFERTVKLAKGSSVLARYNKLALAATKQCGRIFLPKITGPNDVQQTLALLKKDYPDAHLIFGALNPQVESIVELARDGKDIVALIGPEGGLTHEEENLLKSAGASEVRLTDTTLRIETAAVAFAAILCANRDGSV